MKSPQCVCSVLRLRFRCASNESCSDQRGQLPHMDCSSARQWFSLFVLACHCLFQIEKGSYLNHTLWKAADNEFVFALIEAKADPNVLSTVRRSRCPKNGCCRVIP